MIKRNIAMMALALCSLGTPAIAQRAAGGVDLTYAAEKTVHSVVYVKVTINGKTQTVPFSDPFSDFFGDFFGRGGSGGGGSRQIETPKRSGAGSGVILTKDGYIVTNNHVVENADELSVKLNNNKEYKARIIGLDKATDLALIKIEADDLPAITIGRSEDLKLGQWVLAVGNPFNLTSTVTAGIVSAKSRSLLANSVESFIQTDAAINQGNSGGALVNADGELVGINSMLYSQTGAYSGYGFAIPTTIMNKVVDDLKKYGTVQRALLGIVGTDVTAYIDKQKAKDKTVDLGTYEGVYVEETSGDGAAADAGLKAGDVIKALDGKAVSKMAELQEELAKKRPGDVAQLSYLRDKKQHTVKVTLRNLQGTTTVLENVDLEGLGVGLKALSEQNKKELKLDYGLEVTAVREGKMKQAGVNKGLIILQVNERKMSKPEDFEEAVKAANLSSDRVLWIRAKTQSGLNKSFAIELEQKKK